MKSTVTRNRSTHAQVSFETICDGGIVFSLCAAIFALPASIALLDSFAALAIFIYLVKKIYRIASDWPAKTFRLSFLGKIKYIWVSFAPPVNILNRPLQFLSLAVFFSVLFSQFPSLSLFAFFGKFVKCVFLYFSFIEAFSDEKRIRIFIFIFMASAMITALSGAVQHYTGRDFIKGHHIGYENLVSTGRINSSFFGANGFGAYLLPVIALAAQMLFISFSRKKTWVLGVLLTLLMVLFLACLCWTYSRSSWVGYLAILLSMWWMDRRKLVFVVILFLIFIFIFLPSLNQVRNESLLNDNSSGVVTRNETLLHSIKPDLGDIGSGRSAYWEKAISIIRNYPVFGIGLNTYTRYIMLDPNHGVWRYAHNCYLQMAAETGLVGLSCFLWMVFVLLWHGFEGCHRIKDVWSLSILQGAISGLIGLFVQSFVDNTFYTVQLGMLLWVIFGLLVSSTRLNIRAKT